MVRSPYYVYLFSEVHDILCMSEQEHGWKAFSRSRQRKYTFTTTPVASLLLRWISAAALHIVLSFVDLRRDLRCCGTAGRTFTVTDIVTGVVAAPRRSPEAAGKPRKL